MAPVLQKFEFFAIFVLCCVSRGVLTVKIFLDVPDKVVVGQRARLKCDYDLEGERLHFLDWYKDNIRFFHYDPQFSSRVGKQFFPVEGVEVDRQISSPNSIYITDINQSTAGVYMCQVTTGAPHYRAFSEEKRMSIGDFQEIDFAQMTPEHVCYNFTVGAPDKKEFYSPNYPFNYPPDTTCELQLIAPESHVIRLDFPEIFDMQDDDDCRYDWLEVRDGPGDYSPLVARLCGHKRPLYIITQGGYLWLKFHSNRIMEYKGFKAVYQFLLIDEHRNLVEDINNRNAFNRSLDNRDAFNWSLDNREAFNRSLESRNDHPAEINCLHQEHLLSLLAAHDTKIKTLEENTCSFFAPFIEYVSDMTESEKLELHTVILKKISDIKSKKDQTV